MSVVRILGGGEPGRQLEIGNELSIGRDPRNDLSIADPWLSRFHARLVRRRGSYVLEDLGSRNGTYLNGGRVAEGITLADGDRIELGDLEMRYLENADDGALGDESASWDPALPRESTVLLNSRELTYGEEQAEQTASGRGRDHGHLPALHTVASALISDYPLEELTRVVLRMARKVVGAERCALLLLPRRRRRSASLQLDVPAAPGAPSRPHRVPTLPMDLLDIQKAAGHQNAEDLELSAAHGFEQGEEISISRTILREVLENERAVLTLDAQSDARFDASMSLRLQGVRSILCVPLWNNQRVIGVLYLDQRMQGRGFNEGDLRLAGLVANMAAVKIENLYLLEERLEKRRLEEQLRVGAEIQRRLLPAENPNVGGYDLFGENRSCEQVGGDYYDFIPKTGDKLAVVLADVAGKGVGAALLMAVLQASLRALAQDARRPESLVDRINRVLVERSPGSKYATLFYGELDLREHTFQYVNAGHVPPALLRTAEGEVQALQSSGPVVGLLEEAGFKSRTVAFDPGSTLLICTDGITELENHQGEELGRGVLEEVLAEPFGSAREVAEALHRRQVAFCGRETFDDDSTVLVVHRPLEVAQA